MFFLNKTKSVVSVLKYHYPAQEKGRVRFCPVDKIGAKVKEAETTSMVLLNSSFGQAGYCILHVHTVNDHTLLKVYVGISYFAAVLSPGD